jgi:hypothetical protein
VTWWHLILPAYVGIGIGIAVYDWQYYAPREPTFRVWPTGKVFAFAAVFLVLTVLGWPLDGVGWIVRRWRRAHPKPATGRREPGA